MAPRFYLVLRQLRQLLTTALSIGTKMFSLSRRFTAQFSVQSQETIIINGPFYGHFAQSAYHNARQRLKNKLMH